MEGLDYFSAYTGKGIKVAVIDSGIDISHPDISNVLGGFSLFLDENGSIQKGSDYHDAVGHGTACTGIILKKAPDAGIFGIKIFHDERLEAEPDVLLEAVRWSADNGINVINLSLGIRDRYAAVKLKEVCDYASSRNCIIVAADNNEYEDSYPAVFPNVIGVTGGRIKNASVYHYIEDNPIEFIAKGDVQRIAWSDKKYVLLERNSFSAPHITGMVARILESNPTISQKEAREILIKGASTHNTDLIIDKKDMVFSLKKHFRQNNLNEKQNYSWIKKACIYPYNKEMHALVRAQDLLDFSIDSIVDVIGNGNVGKDAGEVIGSHKAGIIVGHDLDKALSDADTLVLGHLSELERIKNCSLFIETVSKAVRMGKNVYHLDPVPDKYEYSLLLDAAARNGTKIMTNTVRLPDEKLLEAAARLKTDIPVVGVFGTSARQGKFTTQLALRRVFIREGYNVAQIGTEPHSELFGFDLCFPIGHNSAVKNLPERYYISYLHYKIVEISHNRRPEIFIVGAQSNILPYDVNEIETVNLGSIAFLLGTKPDAYILAVNFMDSDEYIRRTISGLEALGQGKIICLSISDKEKELRTVFGRSSTYYKQLANTEMEEKIKQLEERFQIPVTDVVSEKGQEKLFRTVVGFFAAER